MKKSISLVIAAIMAAAMLTACGSEKAEENYSEESVTSEVQEVTETEAPEDQLDPEYNDKTAFAAFETYMRALINDDYYTFLAITHKSDSDEAVEDFNDSKSGYVGITMSSIQYFETELSPLYSRAANYRVSEFTSEGDVMIDINTMGTAYGTVIVDKDPTTKTFYVVVHFRYSPFINIV